VELPGRLSEIVRLPNFGWAQYHSRHGRSSQRHPNPGGKGADTENIVASLMHEGYVPTPEAEAVHAQVARGEITSEEAIAIFRERALELDRKLSQAKSK
jgi:Antitoxin VbhA